MFGDFFESIGNFVSGHGFQNNKSRANEDAKNSQRSTTTTTVGVQRQVSTPKSLNSGALFANPITSQQILNTPEASVPNAPIARKPLFEDPTAMKKPVVVQKAVAANPVDNELETIYQQKRQAAIDREGKNLDWFAKNIYDRDWQKRAENAARVQATSEYQDKYGWNNDPTVSKYASETVQKANQLSQNAQDAIKNTKTAVNVMRWVPGAGIGELGANLVRGNFAGSREADDTVLREQLDMTQAQIDQMPQDQRDKALFMAKAGLASGVLDFVGLGAGSLVKSGGKSAAKATVKDLIKNLFTKEGAKALLKRELISGGVGAGIGYGGSKLMGASDEQAIQNAFSGGLTGLGAGLVGAPIDMAADSVKIARGNVGTVKNAITDAADDIPAKPQAVVPLDSGGSISAPVRATASSAKPSAPQVPRQVNELDSAQFGDVSREATKLGGYAGSDLGAYLETRATKSAQELGVNPESVIGKLQVANRNGAKSYDDIGLTPTERTWVDNYQKEMMFLNERANLSNNAHGFQKFYSPQQAVGTEFTPDLVNNMRRGNKLGLDELDNSLTPFNQYVHRYSDAPKMITDDMINRIENIADDTTDTGFRPSGVVVPDEVKASIGDAATEYINKFDQRLGSAGVGAFKDMTDEVSDAADSIVVKALEYLKTQPRTPELDNIIEELSKGRGSYVHTYVEANMLGQLGGRVADQINKFVVEGLNKTTGGWTTRLAEKMTGVDLAPKTKAGKQVVSEWAKGTNLADIKREFRTNQRTLLAQTDNPLSKLSANWRSGTTALVRFADLGTSNAKKAVGYFVREAEDAGLTSKSDIDAYVSNKIASGEYKSVIGATESVTNQNIALSTNKDYKNVQSNNLGLHTIGSFIDNLPKKLSEVVDKSNLPAQAKIAAKKTLKSGITRFITGFARVTSTAASKGIDISTAGVPTLIRGFRALKSADTAAERVAAARTVQQGLTEAISVGGFVALGVAMKDMYTGSYPTDRNEQARWKREGIQPNSFRIPVGDGFLQVQPGRLGAFSLPIVIGASVASGKNENMLTTATDLSSQFAQNFGIDQMGNLFNTAGDALSGDWESALKTFPQIASSIVDGFIPASGLLNEVGNATDRTKRETSTGNPVGDIAAGVASKLPGIREALPARTDTLGQPIENTNFGLGAWITAGGGSSDAVDAEISRLSGADFEVMPANEVKSEFASEHAGLLMNSELYKSASDEDKADMLHEALLGTKTKDINEKLDPAQKQALIEYTVQSEAKRDVWLENNDNALNYYQGKYNNEDANGTLTASDKSMEHTGSLAQLVAIAGVNKEKNVGQDVITSYADTSKSEFNDLADGSAEKEALKAYDQALVDAGLPSKYQNKYGGYGSTGGSSGYGDLSFAKPITADSSASIKASSLAAASDPFANIVKKAPNTKTGLKRNISVNKGVHL